MRDQEADGEPPHHARRPMNAFLIFCKRHRSVVRDKYPNLENRSITKILGEWWANLEKEDKACYTGLAKQYKDAFFNANPDFKWYKLPAPPLRTVSSRPREPHDIKPTLSESPEPDYLQEKTNNNSTKVDFNKTFTDDDSEAEQKPLSMFTPGKLADEAQMGGLSSLLSSRAEARNANSYYTSPFKHNANSSPFESKKRPNSENIQELQNALSETTRLFEDFDDKNNVPSRVYQSGQNNQLTNQDVIDQIVDKRFSKDDDVYGQNRWSDDEKNTRSGRSCKGKRYQAFMAVGGLIVNKRQKREYVDKSPDEGYSASCSWDLNDVRNDSHSNTDEIKQEIGFNENSNSKSDSETNESKTNDQDIHCNKTFKAADFDLDAKIKALPSLSLEKFQQRKRENKRKKKTLNFRTKSDSKMFNSTPYVPDDKRQIAESWKEAVIGSQKRKPRKISITRLEINSTITSVNLRESNKSGAEVKCESPLAESARAPAAVDLLALATLAEVASNTSKIEDSRRASPSHDLHTSKV